MSASHISRQLALRRRSVFRASFAAALISASFAPPAIAALLTWNQPLGGNASTAANWFPPVVPTAGDDLIFNLNNTYTVNWSAAVPQSRGQNLVRGVITYDISSPHTVGRSNQLVIGSGAGNSARLILTTGTLSTSFCLIGTSTAIGRLDVNDADADFFVTSSLAFTVGHSGSGAMLLTGGGFVQADGFLSIGEISSADGIVLVSGTDGHPNFTRSTLSISSPSQSLQIGYQGTGSLTVNGGGLVDDNGDLYIGTLPGSSGTVDVSGFTLGTFSLIPSHIDVGGDLYIGAWDSGDGGVGDLTITQPGIVTVADHTQIAHPTGGTGTLELVSNAVYSSNSIDIQPGGTIQGEGIINGNVTSSGAITASGTNGLTFNGALTKSGGTTLGSKLTIGPAGSLRANGQLPNTVEIFGEYYPGGSNAIGFNPIISSLVLHAGSKLTIEISGAAPGQTDGFGLLGGTVLLDGALIVKPIFGFTPLVGQTFTFNSSNFNSGQFSHVSAPHGMRLDYLPLALQLTMTSCIADVTHDGSIDIDDLTQIILNWGGADPDANIDNDASVDIDDLTSVILAWGSCP